MPRSVEERGNLTIYVGSPEHKRKLKRLLELTKASSASAAIYQAIDFYLHAHDGGRLPGGKRCTGEEGEGREKEGK